jgi:predicted  nucleic acid-binding Zn-ribbon protein
MMTAQLRADVVVSTMAVIAKKIEMMDGRLTEGQARLTEGQARLTEGQARLTEGQARLEGRMDQLEVRMDQLSDDIAAVKSTMDTKFAVLEENDQIINRKLNALLAHIGVAE